MADFKVIIKKPKKIPVRYRIIYNNNNISNKYIPNLANYLPTYKHNVEIYLLYYINKFWLSEDDSTINVKFELAIIIP